MTCADGTQLVLRYHVFGRLYVCEYPLCHARAVLCWKAL